MITASVVSVSLFGVLVTTAMIIETNVNNHEYFIKDKNARETIQKEKKIAEASELYLKIHGEAPESEYDLMASGLISQSDTLVKYEIGSQRKAVLTNKITYLIKEYKRSDDFNPSEYQEYIYGEGYDTLPAPVKLKLTKNEFNLIKDINQTTSFSDGSVTYNNLDDETAKNFASKRKATTLNKVNDDGDVELTQKPTYRANVKKAREAHALKTIKQIQTLNINQEMGNTALDTSIINTKVKKLEATLKENLKHLKPTQAEIFVKRTINTQAPITTKILYTEQTPTTLTKTELATSFDKKKEIVESDIKTRFNTNFFR